MLMRAFNERLTSFRDIISLQKEQRLHYDENKNQFKQEWCDRVSAHKTTLRENRCPPALLHHLAAAYLATSSMSRVRRLWPDWETFWTTTRT